MKLQLKDVPAGGLKIEVASSTEGWWKTILIQIFGDRVTPAHDGRLQLTIQKESENVEIIGGAFLQVTQSCDRCLTEFRWHQQLPIHMILVPARALHPADSAKEANLGDDINFGSYNDDLIPLGDLVREQIILNQPMGYLCREGCKGLCPSCGHNLNEGECQCSQTSSHRPFAHLKSLKTG